MLLKFRGKHVCSSGTVGIAFQMWNCLMLSDSRLSVQLTDSTSAPSTTLQHKGPLQSGNSVRQHTSGQIIETLDSGSSELCGPRMPDVEAHAKPHEVSNQTLSSRRSSSALHPEHTIAAIHAAMQLASHNLEHCCILASDQQMSNCDSCPWAMGPDQRKLVLTNTIHLHGQLTKLEARFGAAQDNLASNQQHPPSASFAQAAHLNDNGIEAASIRLPSQASTAHWHSTNSPRHVPKKSSNANSHTQEADAANTACEDVNILDCLHGISTDLDAHIQELKSMQGTTAGAQVCSAMSQLALMLEISWTIFTPNTMTVIQCCAVATMHEHSSKSDRQVKIGNPSREVADCWPRHDAE